MMSEMPVVAILGGSGRFGRVIARALCAKFAGVRFLFLGRKAVPWAEEFFSFDYRKQSSLPALPVRPDLLLDLTGPIRADDGIAMQAAFRSRIPYLDMAVQNGHIGRTLQAMASFPGATALVHLGFFPGLSNLMAHALARKMESPRSASVPAERLLLWNDFPIYAAGGRHVARSLTDLLADSFRQYHIVDGQKIYFRMHERMNEPAVAQSIHRWQYAEIESLEYSQKELHGFERAIRLRPLLANQVFGALIIAFGHAGFRNALGPWLEDAVGIAKSTLFRGIDPPVSMEVLRLRGKEVVERLSLRVPHAIAFHGFVMASFLRSLLSLRDDGGLGPGLHTPEQVFTLERILPEGDFSEYSLHREQG